MKTNTHIKLVLASASPRRKQLLESIGYNPEIIPADIDETPQPNESPLIYVERISLLKAKYVHQMLPPNHCVLAADTIVVLNNQILGKPKDKNEAYKMLKSLNNNIHYVYSAVTFIDENAQQHSFIGKTKVKFAKLSDDYLQQYASSPEPLDKAGAYGIQGQGGSLVEWIEGSYSNVVGMDICRVAKLLRKEKI